MNRATRIHIFGSTTRDSSARTFAKSSRKIFHGLGMFGNFGSFGSLGDRSGIEPRR